MLAIDIPGFGELRLEHLVLDYNGTLAVDGTLLPGVAERLRGIARQLQVHVMTADTFGTAAAELAELPVDLVIVPGVNQAEAKLDFVQRLDADKVVAIGNGRNDRKMLGSAALGIVVIQAEGAAMEALVHSDIAAASIVEALSIVANPMRMVATLRS